MATDPGWHDKVIEALENAMEFFGPGALTYALRDDGHALAVAPSLLEMEDEEDAVFPYFHFDISSFVKLFDEPPDIGWRTFPDLALSFSGQIDGEDVFVEVLGHPFEEDRPIGVVGEEGNVRELPPDADAVTQEIEEALAKQARAFRDRFGRDPEPGDPLFFDPNADVPSPLGHDQFMPELVAAGYRAGLPSAFIHAIQKTGLIVTDTNRHLLSDADLEEWQAAVEEGKEIYGAVDRKRNSGRRGKPS
jgi:hypothetical protein